MELRNRSIRGSPAPPTSPRAFLRRTRIKSTSPAPDWPLGRLPDAVLHLVAVFLLQPSAGRNLDDAFALANALQTDSQRKAVFGAVTYARFADKPGLRAGLRLFPALESIELTNTHGKVGLGLLQQLLSVQHASAVRNVRKLVVWGMVHMTRDPQQLMQQVAERMPLLEHLKMCVGAFEVKHMGAMNHVSEQGLAAIFEALPRLRHLEFAGAVMTCAEPIARAISIAGTAAAGLEHLHVRQGLLAGSITRVEQQQHQEAMCAASLDLVKTLSASCHRHTLRNLRMSWCELDSAGLIAIAQGLPHLQELHVHERRSRGMRHMDMDAVAYVACNLKQLKVLCINGGLQDCRDLPAALAPLTSLHKLGIRYCGMQPQYMLPLLQALPSLRILDVDGVFEAGGQQHVASWAPALTNLERLMVWSTPSLCAARLLVPHVAHLKALGLPKYMGSHYLCDQQTVSFLRSALPASCCLELTCTWSL